MNFGINNENNIVQVFKNKLTRNKVLSKKKIKISMINNKYAKSIIF